MNQNLLELLVYIGQRTRPQSRPSRRLDGRTFNEAPDKRRKLAIQMKEPTDLGAEPNRGEACRFIGYVPSWGEARDGLNSGPAEKLWSR